MKINLHFIWFVFFRYLWTALVAGIVLSIFSYFIFLPESRNLEFILSFSFGMGSFMMAVLLPITFMGAPYYDCENGKHWIYISGEYGSEAWKCMKCDYHKDVRYKRIRVTKRILDE